MMIARFSVFSVCGVLATILCVSQSAHLRPQKDVASEAADEAALMRNLIEEFENERRLIEEFENERRLIEKFENERRLDGLNDNGFEEEVASEAAEAALIIEEFENERGLQADLGGWDDVVPCNSGWGPLPFPFYLNPEIWGTCETMHRCMCGLDSRRFAYMCPNKCRPSCGGVCATTHSGGTCPTGLSFDMYGNKRSLGTTLAAPDSGLWPWNLGMPCPVYDHTGNYNP